MKYAFICKDGGDKSQLRTDLMQDHLSHVESVLDKIVLAGPCPPTGADDARDFEGSILVFEADTPEAAWELFNSDPYAKAGVWDDVQMMAFKPVAGSLLGGKTW